MAQDSADKKALPDHDSGRGVLAQAPFDQSPLDREAGFRERYW